MADRAGGAISSVGPVTITASTFRITELRLRAGQSRFTHDLTVTDSTFVYNQAGSGGALALYRELPGDLATLTNTRLRDNHSENDGGAILVSSSGRLNVVGGDISSNKATNGDGGGIYVQRDGASLIGGSATLTGVALTGNTAGRKYAIGGGIANIGTLTLNKVTLTGNEADYGGGVFNSAMLDANGFVETSATLTNVTLTGNRASQSGGGIYESGLSILTNVTLTLNAAGQGAGIYFADSRGTWTNVVLADNSNSVGIVTNCGRGDSGASNVRAGYTLSSDMSCEYYDAGMRNQHGTPALLGPLADNGGGMLTHLPQPGSPLIDGGLCLATAAADQRGVVRPQGAACDIGAVEVAPPSPVPSPTAGPSPVPSSPAPASRRILLPMAQR